MKNTRRCLLLFVLFFLLSVGGCYTILKHPPAEESGHAYSREYYHENCLDCHPDYHEYPYGSDYGYYPDYYFDNPRFSRYYVYPWWWEPYDYDDNYHGGSDAVGRPAAPGSRSGIIRSRGGGASPPATGESSTFRRESGTTKGGNQPASTGGKKTDAHKKEVKPKREIKTTTTQDENKNTTEKKDEKEEKEKPGKRSKVTKDRPR